MRRPHPYLAVSLACAAVVAVTLSALACPASAQAWLPIPPRTPTPTPTPTAEPQCLPLINDFIVWPGSPQCTADRYSDVLNVPTQERVAGIRYFTSRVLNADLMSGALTTPLSMGAWGDIVGGVNQLVPVFYDRPLWGAYAVPPGYTPNCGISYCTCASGVGEWPPKIDVSQKKSRVEQLVAWELTNAALGRLQRSDLWDGPYVSSVVTRVGQQLGGWSQ